MRLIDTLEEYDEVQAMHADFEVPDPAPDMRARSPLRAILAD